MSAAHGFVAAAKALIGQALISRAVGLVTSIALARGLGPNAFGHYSATVSTASSIYGVVRLGVDAAIHVDTAKGSDAPGGVKLGAVLGAGLLLFFGAALAAAAGSWLLADWLALNVFGAPALSAFMICAGVMAAFQCISQFAYAVLAGLNQFGVYARFVSLNAVLILMLSVCGMLAWGAFGAVLGSMLAALVFALGLFHRAFRELRARSIAPVFAELGPAIAHVLRFGLPHYAASLVAVPVFLYLQGLLARSWGLDALAMYRVIGTFAALVLFVPATTSSALTTALARGGAGERLWDNGILGVKATGIATLVIAVALCTVLAPLITLLFGASYLPAYLPGVVGILSAPLSCVLVNFVSLFHALRRADLILLQALGGAAASLALGGLLIPTYGLLGYMAGELAGTAAATAVLVAATSRFVDHPRTLRLAGALLVFALAIASAIALLAFAPQSLLAGLLACTIAAVLLLGSRSLWLVAEERAALAALWTAFTRRSRGTSTARPTP